MAKRFTSTEKWSDPWFMDLPPRLKCMWDWIYSNCDIAGSIEINWKLASFQIGEQVGINDLVFFDGRLMRLNTVRYWIVKFIEYQYGQLTDSCPAHRPVIALCDRLSIPYQYPINRVQEKEKEEDKEKDKEKEKEKGLYSGFNPILICSFFEDADFQVEWMKWIDSRREIKKPLKSRAAESQLSKFGAWGKARSIAAIQHSIACSYQGIFEPLGKALPQHKQERSRNEYDDVV